MGIRDSDEWRRGEIGVAATIRELHGLGYGTARLDLIEEGGAPSIHHGDGTRIVVPDLLCSKTGKPLFVEPKYKKTAALWRNADIRTHGVDSRNLIDYRKAEDESGMDCLIAIFEADTSLVLCQWLSGLELVDQGTGARGRPVQFFTRRCLKAMSSVIGKAAPRQMGLF